MTISGILTLEERHSLELLMDQVGELLGVDQLELKSSDLPGFYTIVWNKGYKPPTPPTSIPTSSSPSPSPKAPRTLNTPIRSRK